MATIDKIKSTPIISVLDKLWYTYKKTWPNEYRLYDWSELTDWWTATDKDWKNFVHDHAWKGRCSWDTFWFVKNHFNFDDSEVYKWYEENFWYEWERTISDIWKWLPQLNQSQVDYLLSRGVDYWKVKDIVKSYNWWIWCLVYDWDIPKGLTARTLEKDHAKRFIAAAWFSTKWVYKHRIDPTKKYLIVVEWLIDFLTIRQFETNVIGLKSATDWFEYVEKLAWWYDIIFIPDNDEAGKKSIKNLSWIEHKLVDLAQFESDWITIKDVNDLYSLASSWIEFPWIIDIIMDNAQYVAPINSVIKELKRRQKLIAERWKLWEDWPLSFLDELTEWIVEWKTYQIAAYSNVWKSKFAYYHVAHFLKKWKKVLIINLEVDDVTCLANVIAPTEDVTVREAMSTYQPTDKLYRKLIIKDSITKLQDIVDCVRSYQPDYVFIDYVQNIQADWSSYEKHATIASAVQRIWIETWCTVFTLSQLSNDSLTKIRERRFDEITPKNAWEYFACSDVIYLLYNEDQELNVRLIKNKFWAKPNKSFILDVEWNKNRYWLKRINNDE